MQKKINIFFKLIEVGYTDTKKSNIYQKTNKLFSNIRNHKFRIYNLILG